MPHRMRMVGIDTYTGKTTHWIELYRWRWTATLIVWMCRYLPQSGQYRILAEIID
jgi:hypothetical protein